MLPGNKAALINRWPVIYFWLLYSERGNIQRFPVTQTQTIIAKF